MIKAVKSILTLKWVLFMTSPCLHGLHQNVTLKSNTPKYGGSITTMILETVSQSLQDAVRSGVCSAGKEVLVLGLETLI